MPGNNGNGAGNIVAPSGGDRWADKKKIVMVISGVLVDSLSDIDVRRFFGMAPSDLVTVNKRRRMARLKAPLVYDSMIEAVLLASSEEITGTYTGWAWKNSAVVYLTDQHFSGMVWDGGKWVSRVEKTGLNFGGIMRAGMCKREKLNLTACDSSGVPIGQLGAFVPFKSPAMANGVYVRAQFARSLWPSRRSAVLGAGWFLAWEPGEYGGFEDIPPGPVNILYGPLAGASIDDQVMLPWPDSLLEIKLYPFVVNYKAANSKDGVGNEYKWAFGPFFNPPFLDSVHWVPFREAVSDLVFRCWFTGAFVRELNE